MARRGTPLSRIQLFVVGPLYCCCHDVSFTVVTRKNLHRYQTLQASLLTERRRLRQHCRSGIQAISYRQALATSADAFRSQSEKTLVSERTLTPFSERCGMVVD